MPWRTPALAGPVVDDITLTPYKVWRVIKEAPLVKDWQVAGSSV
jgi:hypothetical protein